MDGEVTSEHFRRHMERDLRDFWCREEVVGTPPGNFPSYLRNDGVPMSHAEIMERMANEPQWIRDHAHLEYCRTRVRNLFGLCAIFHVTGDRRVLRLMRQSIAFLRARVLLAEGRFVSAWDRTTGRTHDEEPNSQEFALLLQGLGFYYFLTRSPQVLHEMRAIFRRLEQLYRCPVDPFLLTWTPASTAGHERDLRGVLDQLNSYMLLLSPVLPSSFVETVDAVEHARRDHDAETDAFRHHIRGYVEAIRRHFYEPSTGLFRVTCRTDGGPVDAHTDCGHTVKALWVTYIAGKRLGDTSLVDFARNGIARIARRAFMPDHQGWCINFWPDGRPIEEFEWWSYTMFDQALATLSLEETGLDGMLNAAYRTWFAKLVDQQHGEVFHNVVNPRTGEVRYPKVHLWKDAYHTCDHALVGYLTSRPREDKVVYFAIDDASSVKVLYPYLFRGDIVGQREHDGDSGRVQEICVRNIRC